MKQNFFNFTKKGMTSFQPKLITDDITKTSETTSKQIITEISTIKPIDTISKPITLKPKLTHKNNIHFLL